MIILKVVAKCFLNMDPTNSPNGSGTTSVADTITSQINKRITTGPGTTNNVGIIGEIRTNV